MKMTLEMTEVSTCRVTQCTYNREQQRHAMAITIGHDHSPMCDTFMESRAHSHGSVRAGVGACKVSACAFNEDFQCQAGQITVDTGPDRADCATFRKR